MSQSIALLTLSLVATEAITAERFVNSAGAVSDVGEDVIGVAKTAAASGDRFPVDVIGTAVVTAGAAVAANALVQSDATGRAVTATASAIKTAVIAGGSAGDLTVTGIKTTDRLVAVIRLDRDSTAANVTLGQLTSEFSITATNTINNAGGTATTGDALLVVYETANPVRGRALQAASQAGDRIEVLLFNR